VRTSAVCSFCIRRCIDIIICCHGQCQVPYRAGCKRKFDVNKYIAKVDSAIRELKDGKGTGPQNNSMLNYLQPKAGRKK